MGGCRGNGMGKSLNTRWGHWLALVLCLWASGLLLESAPALASTGPEIAEESVSEVTATSVTFNVLIDPNNSNTHYYFRYGTSTAYGAVAPALPGNEPGLSKWL